MKLLCGIAVLFVPVIFEAQTTNTTSGGLNQNEVNVVRDGDFPESNSGVIRMEPSGKKGKVMKMVPDTAVQPVVTSTAVITPSTVPVDSTTRFRDTPPKKATPKKTPVKKSPVKTPKTKK